jgi:hypothetical protein
MIHNLLPEEDALEDPDDEEADPSLPGDLWFLSQSRSAMKTGVGRSASGPVVYSRTFVPAPARNYETRRLIPIHNNR